MIDVLAGTNLANLAAADVLEHPLELTERWEPALEFRPMLPGDAVLLDMQDSQKFELGLWHSHFTFDQGEDLADNGVAWTAYRGPRIVAIAGLRETHKGQALAWAALSGEVGPDHLAITRRIRATIDDVLGVPSPTGGRVVRFHRIEAIVDAEDERAITWAMCVGLKMNAVLKKYGPEAKAHLLFERVAP